MGMRLIKASCVGEWLVIKMKCVLVTLLALTAVAAQEDCKKPPLWLFALPEDLEPIFPDLTQPFVLIEDGVVVDIARSPDPALTAQLALSGNFFIFPLVWCTDGQEGITYSFKATSFNQQVLENPSFSIPLTGVVPSRPYRYQSFFRCVGTSATAVIVEVETNTTSAQGERFCTVAFYFGKRCDNIDSSGELITSGFFALTDGFVNTSIKDDGNGTNNTNVQENSETPTGVIVASTIVPGVFLATVVILFLLWVFWYRARNKTIRVLEPEALGLVYQQVYSLWQQRGPHEKEFPQAQLKLARELGEGAFGMVYEAQALGIVEEGESTVVAVKQLKGGSEGTLVEDFFREVEFMSKLDHPQVVRLLGVCSVEEPFSMVFEYMDLGDLCSFLREAIGLGEGESALLTQQELLHIVNQVAEGMEYISSLHLVHRDLATRNCLVSTGIVIKIADFGMSRDLYSSDYYRVRGSAFLPVRWMPPESILYGKFTIETDVWAYGILMWEVFTFGQQPYPGMANEEVMEHVQKGGRPTLPPDCPCSELMLQCWERAPKKRPTFTAIAKALQELMTELDHESLITL